MKNLDPKDASAIEKGAVAYSNAWNIEKIMPRMTVASRAVFAFANSLFNIS